MRSEKRPSDSNSTYLQNKAVRLVSSEGPAPSVPSLQTLKGRAPENGTGTVKRGVLTCFVDPPWVLLADR
jgi:hypothetical protein